MASEAQGGAQGGTNARALVTRTRAVPGTITTVGAPIVVTRPNDTTAYTNGDVFGAAADARIALPVPAPPATGVDGATFYLSTLTLFGVNGGPNVVVGTPALNLALFLFSAQPATVIADNAQLALSDADVALGLLSASGNPAHGIVTLNSANFSNYGGAGKLRRYNSSALGTGLDYGNVGNVTVSFPTNTIIYAYLFFQNNTYVPTALETFTITPRFTWSVVPA